MTEWIEFETTDKGWEIVPPSERGPSVQRRRHKGIEYPDVVKDKNKIKSWHEKGSKLLLELDISAEDADKIKDKKAKRLTPSQAKQIKAKVFNIIEVKSGVSG